MKPSKRSRKDRLDAVRTLIAGPPCNWVTRTTISIGGVNIEDQIEMNGGTLQRYVVTVTDQFIPAETLRSIRILNLLPLEGNRRSIGTILEFPLPTQTSSGLGKVEGVTIVRKSKSSKKNTTDSVLPK